MSATFRMIAVTGRIYVEASGNVAMRFLVYYGQCECGQAVFDCYSMPHDPALSRLK